MVVRIYVQDQIIRSNLKLAFDGKQAVPGTRI